MAQPTQWDMARLNLGFATATAVYGIVVSRSEKNFKVIFGVVIRWLKWPKYFSSGLASLPGLSLSCPGFLPTSENAL